MTKIPSVEERVEEFEKLLDENEGITVGEDITPYVYDIITADRTALLTELREYVVNLCRKFSEVPGRWSGAL